ncbi:MAG TPA: DUF3108 domain-containing protein [Usitatibacter sp.]|nr:DUF3108 domain-containing protein [Usitatibacter sp.]
MPGAAELLYRYRAAAAALHVSAAAHATVMLTLPARISAIDEDVPPRYSASLEASVSAQAAPASAPAPARPRAPRPHPKSRMAPPPPPPLDFAPMEPAPHPETRAFAPAPEFAPSAAEQLAEARRLEGEKLALAQPAVPVRALEPEKFPVDALPARISIDYHLTSSFADGRATYRWSRDGDSYRIDAEAEAEGFFAMFLEGRILQESHGSMTARGLRPESFSERKPGGPPEGLEFDWARRLVTFDRKGEKTTSALGDDTVDWLSMIFQLAHAPPSGESFDLQVFTQRRMYRFRLKVLGVEEIEIPIGRVSALHLRHVSEENAKEVVDVWLGLQQHNLPVKLRFPVARNRLMVEQVATRIAAE